MKSKKREYYILAGDKGLKEILIEKGIEISPTHLVIVSNDSKLGKLIEKEAYKQFSHIKSKASSK